MRQHVDLAIAFLIDSENVHLPPDGAVGGQVALEVGLEFLDLDGVVLAGTGVEVVVRIEVRARGVPGPIGETRIILRRFQLMGEIFEGDVRGQARPAVEVQISLLVFVIAAGGHEIQRALAVAGNHVRVPEGRGIQALIFADLGWRAGGMHAPGSGAKGKFPQGIFLIITAVAIDRCDRRRASRGCGGRRIGKRRIGSGCRIGGKRRPDRQQNRDRRREHMGTFDGHR